MKILNNLQKEFKLWQISRYGGYDTFGYCSKGKINRRLCNKKARRKMKLQNKFYEGYEEFIKEIREEG